MKNNLTIKKIISTMIALVLVLSSISITALGAISWDHPDDAFNVELYKDQLKTYSGSKTDPYMKFEGRNTSANHKVYFIMQYSNDKKETWDDDTTLLVNPDTIFRGQKSSTRVNKPYWRLCLDTYGIGTGGTGYGWTW